MLQSESIYNLLPVSKIIPPPAPLYRSMHPHWTAPTATTFILKNTSYPGVANMGGFSYLPRGGHPIYGEWRNFGRPIGGYRNNPDLFFKSKERMMKIIPPIPL